jgi:hypothetical protein
VSNVNGCTKLSIHHMEVSRDIRLSWLPMDFLKLKASTIMTQSKYGVVGCGA